MSGLNLVGRFFAEITVKLLRRGVHRSVTALEKDIRSWIEQWNTSPKSYVWTRTADRSSSLSPPTVSELTTQNTRG